QLADAAGFSSLIIANRDGHPVRLGDVTRVIDSVETTTTASWYDGSRSILMAVQRQPDANTVDVVDRVKAMLPSFSDQLPAAASIKLLNDRSTSFRQAVSDVELTLALTIALVVMVIFLFLRRVTATAIPAVAVPISLIATLGVMFLFGFSIDNVSLMGLTLAVGLVIDDAIVMLENIYRHMEEEGLSAVDAALKGAGEIGFTIISISISLVAVFIRVLLMGGVVGRIFNEFAMVVTISIAASALISLTLTPMLAARLPAGPAHGTAKKNLFERGFDRVQASYRVLLDLCLRFRFTTFLVFLASVGLTAWMFAAIPKGFFPTEDIGQLSIATEGRQDVSFPSMASVQRQAEEILRRSPYVAHVVSRVGTNGFTGTMNAGSFFVELKPFDERPPLPEILAALRRQLDGVAGLSTFITPVQNLRLGGRQSKSQYQFVVQGLNKEELDRWAVKLADAMERDPRV